MSANQEPPRLWQFSLATALLLTAVASFCFFLFVQYGRIPALIACQLAGTVMMLASGDASRRLMGALLMLGALAAMVATLLSGLSW